MMYKFPFFPFSIKILKISISNIKLFIVNKKIIKIDFAQKKVRENFNYIILHYYPYVKYVGNCGITPKNSGDNRLFITKLS